MRVPLLDLKPQLQALEAEIKSAVNAVIDSTRYIMGPRVEELEDAVASYAKARYAVGVASGTDALLVSLMALDVGPGDIVIVPTYSFFATAGVVTRLNATPALIDCAPRTYNIDPVALRGWLADNADKIDRVKAIIPVHLYGQCADMDAILAIAAEHNIAVVEDAAQAIGATYPTGDGKVRPAGSMGTCGCFSFFPSKNLGGIGDGGMVTTNDEALAEKIRQLRMHGESTRYHHAIVGGNFRLDPIQAAVLLVKLPHLERWHAMRRENAARYDAGWQVDGLTAPAAVHGREHHIYNQYVISVPRDRDGLQRHLAEAEIGSAIYYPIPFHMQECFKNLGYRPGDFPVAEQAARQTLALPIYPELTSEMQDFVIATINAFYG